MTRACVTVLLLATTACTRPAPQPSAGPAREHRIEGTVVRLDAQHRTATIKHGPIDTWMEAMTMEFPVKNREDFDRLRVGMKIRAKVFDRPSTYEYWLEQVEELRADSKRIESRFLAPCCWSEDLAVHSSPAAREMRAEIEALVAQGRSENEIVDYYVSRYGERILRDPRGRSWWVLTWAPVIALASGTALVVRLLARMRTQTAGAGSQGGATAAG